MFELNLGSFPENYDVHKVTYRTAVRSVVYRDGKLLMASTNKGDFKFPGGGVEPTEDLERALHREMVEETGFEIDKIEHLLGTAIERRCDLFDEDDLFEMISHYYLCHIKDDKKETKLDAYEVDLDLKPVWITIDEALDANEKHIDANPWVKREIMVLKALKELEGKGLLTL